MKKIIIIVLLISIITGLLFLTKNNSTEVVEKHKLTFGVHPYLEKQHLQEKFQPLIDYLSVRINKEIELKISSSYEEHIKLVGLDSYDFSYIGPYSYIMMVEEYDIKEILASMTTYDIPYFTGVIFARQKAGITRMVDLKNKKFAFGKPNSTMSHIVPAKILEEAGINKDDFSEYQYLENHEQVVFNVLSGKFDAGAVKETVFDKYKAKGLREIARSRQIAEHVFVSSDTLYAPTKQKIQQLLLTLADNEVGKNILHNIKHRSRKLQPTDNLNFNSLREYLDINPHFKWQF